MVPQPSFGFLAWVWLLDADDKQGHPPPDLEPAHSASDLLPMPPKEGVCPSQFCKATGIRAEMRAGRARAGKKEESATVRVAARPV